jgi:Spy/CpxP family protein refolding chaperone
MKTTRLLLSLAVMALVSMPAMAKKNSKKSAKTDATTTEATACTDGEKGECPGEQNGKKGMRPMPNPFEGITLTDDQKTQLKNLETERREAFKAKMEAKKQQAEQAKADGATDFKAERKANLQKMREILGTDNYITYLENIAMMQGAGTPGRAPKQQANGPRKGDRRAGFAQRGPGAPRPDDAPEPAPEEE